jgi:hypothetical protein
MRYLLCLLSLLTSITCVGQTISKYLVNDYKIKDTSITEVVESKSYIESSGTSTYEKTFHYNNKGFLILRVGLDTDGKLSSRINYDYDENGNLILIKEELWNHSIGYSVTTTNFIYNTSGLKAIQIFGTHGELEINSIVSCEKGFPLSIHSYDSANSLIGTEVAKYDFLNNKVTITIANNLGNAIGKPIELNVNLSNRKDFKLDGVIYDTFGEISKELKHKCYSCDDLVTYEYSYTYDKQNNWIKKLTYLKDGSDYKKIEITKRKIKYKKGGS